MKKVIILALIASFATTVYSHGGRTDSTGCHNDNKTGTRHCH
ncbi:YHYH domain-containing protein [Acinetobacter sp. ANC 5045]|nr:YHYH domain-containing protein [Acinetobacter sp. ANC 5045]TCB17304.1 YHYH domain-containing protein [Acinetobacter sp. ANC 5045]